MKSPGLHAFFAVALFSLAGCGNDPADQAGTPDAATEPDVTETASVEMNEPVPSTALDLAAKLVHGPEYSPATDMVTARVQMTNNGTSAVATAGTHPIQLGLVIRDADGKMDRAPALQDFVRIPLPQPVEPGGSLVVPISFPATPAIGGIVVLDGVQEGVSWFSSYGEPTLEIGRFARCEGDASALCFADGAVVPHASN